MAAQPPKDTKKGVNLDFTGVFNVASLKPEPAPPPKPIPENVMIGANALRKGSYFVNMTRARAPRKVDPAKTTILIVEDDLSTLTLLHLVLSRLGYLTRRASDAATFILAMQQAPIPDLVLLDLELPGNVSGLKILSKIRAHPAIKHLPVIILSGHAEPENLLQGVTLGADGYVSKPVASQTLLNAIKTVLGG